MSNLLHVTSLHSWVQVCPESGCAILILVALLEAAPQLVKYMENVNVVPCSHTAARIVLAPTL